MRKTEHQHNSPEQVQEYLAGALAAVEALEPPPELLAVAFAKAIDLLSSKQVFYEQGIAPPILRPQ